MPDKIKNKSYTIKALYWQILFVVFAFMLMVLSSYLFARRIEKNHLEDQIEYYFVNIESLLNANLKEFETMLEMASETIRGLMLQGFDLDFVKKYMVEMTEYAGKAENTAGFFGFYAGFGEDGLDGFNALHPDANWDDIIASGYNPKERPWYIAAESAGNKIAVTEPYPDEITKEVAFTYVKNIYDENGKRLAIICMDVLLDRLYKFSYENRSNDFIYWTLHDTNNVVIAHPNDDFIGMPFRDTQSGFAVLADEIEKKGGIYNRFALNYSKEPSFFTIKRLDNGWYLGIVAKADSFFSNLVNIIMFLVSLGVILASALIAILIRLNSAKEKSDKRLQKAVEERRALSNLNKILNSINAMIFVSDPENDTVLFINESMKKVFGVETDSIGLVCYKVLRRKEARCEFCPCRLLDEDPGREVIWEQHNDITGRDYQNYSKYIKWINGKNVHIQYSVDITANRMAEQEIARKNEELKTALANAETANQTKTRFLAKMSHEIRTPMNAIIGMTELALREKSVDAKNEHIHTVKQAASNLLSIINDILDFSKIEAGKMEIIPADYFPAALLNDIVSIIRMRVIDSQIRFVVKVDSRIPAVLYGDETRIRQAVLNILNNAVKYTEDGHVSFSVQAEFTGEDTVNLIFNVSDTGIGIKQEDMDRLFEDFVQFDLDKNKNIEGVGLGLTITKNIVEAMGGKIEVKSVFRQSSSFTITLPQKYKTREAMAFVAESGSKKALIYERRDIFADSLIYTVKNLGVECSSVSNGTELYVKMEKEIFDYLFISYTLYKKNEDTILKFGEKTKIVILAGFGEIISEKKLITLTMPVYCIAIADIFNGRYGTSLNSDETETAVKFSAPEASVLIVDDINTNLKVAEGLMTPYNMNVDVCNSGKAAIEAVKKKKYDIVFMDHKMPEMDGVEATRRIREWERTVNSEQLTVNSDDISAESVNSVQQSPVPIIALTANAVSGMEEMFFENGFNDFISKPINTGQLNSILEKWIPKEKQEGVRS